MIMSTSEIFIIMFLILLIFLIFFLIRCMSKSVNSLENQNRILQQDIKENESFLNEMRKLGKEDENTNKS